MEGREEREAAVHTGHFESRGKLLLRTSVISGLDKTVYLFFPRVPYGRLNSEGIWTRRKSRRLPVIPGGIYSSRSGKLCFRVERNKGFQEVSNVLTDWLQGNDVQTKEYKTTGC